MESIQEEWNNSDVSASTSVFDISTKFDNNNIHNNSEISEIKFPVNEYDFENSSNGEDTALFQAVPSDQTILESAVDKQANNEEILIPSPTRKKKIEKTKKEKKSDNKRRRRTISSDQNNLVAILPVEMESLSLINNDNLNETNTNDLANIHVSNIRQINESSRSETSHNENLIDINEGVNNTTILIRSESTFDRSETLDTSTNSEARINTSSIITSLSTSVSCDCSQTETDCSSTTHYQVDSILVRPEQKSSVIGHRGDSSSEDISSNSLNIAAGIQNEQPDLQNNIPATNTENAEKNLVKPKRARRQPKTKTKGTQVNVKTRAPKAVNEVKQVNEEKSTQPKQKTNMNNRVANKRKQGNKDKENTPGNEENMQLPEKLIYSKDFSDIVCPSELNVLQNPSTSVTDRAPANGGNNYKVSAQDVESTSDSTSYTVNIIKDTDDDSQPITISLPPQATSKLTNINVIVTKKTDPSKQPIKERTIETIDLTVNSPQIKKEKQEKVIENGQLSVKHNEGVNQKHLKNSSNNKNQDYESLSKQTAQRQQIPRSGSSTLEEDSSTDTDDSNSTCSCIHCEGSDECSCSDCLLELSSCSCSDCYEDESDSTDRSCHCHSRQRHR